MRVESACASGESKGSRNWKNTSCRPMSRGRRDATARWNWLRWRDGIVVDVDHAVEHGNCRAHRACKLFKIETQRAAFVCRNVTGEVDRAKVADGGLLPRGHLSDLRAKVGEMDDVAGFAGLVAF